MTVVKIILIAVASFLVIWNVFGLIRDIRKNRKRKKQLQKEIEENERSKVDKD